MRHRHLASITNVHNRRDSVNQHRFAKRPAVRDLGVNQAGKDELARGIDESEVVPDRPTQSISVEDTFEKDVLLRETEPMIRRLAEKLWSASRLESRTARTVVLKLKTSEFRVLTRSHTPDCPPSSCKELTEISLKLRERVKLDPQQRYRLVGVGLSNFREAEDTAAQPARFE